MRIVSISSKRDTLEREEKDSIGAWLKHDARDMTKDNIDGYAIVAFEYEGSETMITRVKYRVRNVGDKFMLPDMAKEKIRREIDRSVTFIPDEGA